MTSKKVLIFDLETDGLLDACTTIHCMGYMWWGDDEPSLTTDPETMVRLLEEADVLVAHNALRFDIPVVAKVLGWSPSESQEIEDTLVLARVAWSNRYKEDAADPGTPLVKKEWGSHSLDAWGKRLGEHKGAYTGGWSKYSQEMGDYCLQDVHVLVCLYEAIRDLLYDNGEPRLCVSVEMSFAPAIAKMTETGVMLDQQAAADLAGELTQSVEEFRRDLIEKIPGTTETMKSPQYWLDPDTDTKYPTKTGAPYRVRGRLTKGPMRIKTIPFNPTSRQQTAAFFEKKYGWQPREYTGNGKPKIDEKVLKSLPYPEARIFEDLYRDNKLLGSIANGASAFLKRVTKAGRIHGRVDHNGAISGRCTHSRPNLANPDSDPRVRALFIPTPGYVMLGWDASGLELRMLAHYMGDPGYCRLVEEGDVHTHNQHAANLKTRDQAKTFIYALIYGAGNEKLGDIQRPDGTVNTKRSLGAKARKAFMLANPQYARLASQVAHRVEAGEYLRGLDGRPLKARSAHSALNVLLQSGGAVVMKMVTNRLVAHLRATGIGRMVLHVHDEVQVECLPHEADEVGAFLNKAIEEVGEELNLRVKMAGEYKIGTNWSETH